MGRRATFLLLFGGIYLLLGMAQATREGQVLAVAFPVLAEPWVVVTAGGTWALAGAVAIGYGLLGDRRSRDVGGFVALSVPASGWSALYGLAWLLAVIPGGNPGYARGGLIALVYGLLVVAVLVVAGWPEPPSEEDRR